MRFCRLAQDLVWQWLWDRVTTAAADPTQQALALRIEAAQKRGDPAATRYARDYLARYPRGRYRALANRALAVRSAE